MQEEYFMENQGIYMEEPQTNDSYATMPAEFLIDAI